MILSGRGGIIYDGDVTGNQLFYFVLYDTYFVKIMSRIYSIIIILCSNDGF